MAGSILFVDLSNKVGGAERSLRELISGLSARYDGEVALASASGVDNDLPCRVYRVSGVRLHRPSRVFSFLRSVADLCAARKALRTVVRDASPDVIVANNIAALFALPRTRAKVVWYVRDMPRRPYASFAALRSDLIIAISRAVESRCRKSLPVSACDKIRLVENGIDLSRFASVVAKSAARLALGIDADSFVVGMMANLVPWKRHDLFVDIAAAVTRLVGQGASQRMTWVIAGDDLYGEHAEYVACLKRRVAEYGLDGSFRWLCGKSATDILPALDILVHPAQEEPFGRVICEAMACGVPVIASNDAGPGEILVDGKSGILVNSPSAERYASEVLRLMRDGDMRAKLTNQAKLEVASRFSHHRVAADFQKCLL